MHDHSTAGQTRLCVWCKSPHVPHPDEKLSTCLRRKSCSRSCANANRAARVRSLIPSKECIVCGVEFFARVNDNGLFGRRVTCSRTCGITHANRTRYAKVAPGPKPCIICGSTFTKRDAEMPAPFKLRRTCSPECHAQFISRQKIDYHADDRVTPYPPAFTKKMKASIRGRDQFACQLCGELEPIERAHAVHHIDYDKANLTSGNLITLCHSCHTATNFRRDYWRSVFAELLA